MDTASVKASKATAAAIGAMRCAVEAKVFLGNSLVVYLKHPAQGAITVRSTDRAQFDGLEPGQPAYLEWRDDDCSVLAE